MIKNTHPHTSQPSSNKWLLLQLDGIRKKRGWPTRSISNPPFKWRLGPVHIFKTGCEGSSIYRPDGISPFSGTIINWKNAKVFFLFSIYHLCVCVNLATFLFSSVYSSIYVSAITNESTNFQTWYHGARSYYIDYYLLLFFWCWPGVRSPDAAISAAR